MLYNLNRSLLVMRNNSADTARHAMCASPTRRVTITFSRVRPNTVHNHHSAAPSPFAQHMAPVQWQPAGVPSLAAIHSGAAPSDVIPVIHAPIVMVAPLSVSPMVSSPRRITGSEAGTGVFLPWGVGSRRPTKHLPPRSCKGRFLAPVPIQTQVSDTMSDPGVPGI